MTATPFQILASPQTTSKNTSSDTYAHLKDWNYVILRDDYGVPHVFANTTEELSYGVGYAIAEDRLWQADLFRREATGRLSELGLGNISIDLWTRINGYSKQENSQLFTTLQSPYKEMISAYTDGINQYITDAIADPEEKMPYEYILRGITPEPWTVEDSLAIGQLNSALV